MNNIFEAYKSSITTEQVEYAFDRSSTIHESILLTALLAALSTGVFLKIIDANKKNKPKVIDWLAGFLRWGMQEYEGTVDFRDIKKHAYVGYEDLDDPTTFFEAKGSNILKKLKAAAKKGKSSLNKYIGTLLGKIVKDADLDKKTIDAVVKKAETGK